MEIRQLGFSEYKGMTLNVTYETERFYDVAVRENGFELLLSQFDEPQIKSFSTELFSQWLEAPIAFGAFEGERLTGVIDGSIETWHNLFRISNIWVDNDMRRKRTGQTLMNKMIEFIRRNYDCRGIILETQTCNYPAICFYKKNGYRLCRIDIKEYTNSDVESKEVRIDMLLEF